MAKNFNLQPLSERNQRKKTPPPVETKPVKVTAELPADLHEHLVSYCFFQYETQSEVLVEALRDFLKDKPNQPLPEKVRNRPRPGRKPKS